MANNLEKLTRLKHLKQLSEKTKTELDALSGKVDGLATVGGEPNVITTVKVNGTALGISADKEVDITVPTKVSDLTNDSNFQTDVQVAATVAAASHLKRKIVASVDAIDVSATDADQYVYMVQKSTTKNGNKYDEYMVIDGAVERVGDWAVDLSGYVQKEEGKGLSTNDYTDGDKGSLDAIKDAMYQAPTATQFRAIIPAYSGTGPITEATVGGLLGDEALAGLTASGTDEAGQNLYDFVVNGVTTGSYTKDVKLAEIVRGINSSKTAGVSAVYSEEEAKFIFTAKQPGPNVNIIIGEGLAAALFDAIEPTDWSAVTFATAYDCFWLTSADKSEAFTFSVIGGSSAVETTITGVTSLQDVVNTLNNSPQKMFYIFSCNRYTGQIEVKKKTSGDRAELKILDRFNKNVSFDATTAPIADPYVYGQDAVFTAVKVNGTAQVIAGKAVDITVPTKVSQLINDKNYIGEEDIATDEEIAAMLEDVFGDKFIMEEDSEAEDSESAEGGFAEDELLEESEAPEENYG